jgi:V/A-type H+-transporting ATPase subunit A
MMTVVGEEGTPIGDFTVMLKTELFDNCFLQQNAFDEVDGATPAERQQFVFDKILEVLELDFDFESKEQARKIMFHGQDLFRNWNYEASDSEAYKESVRKIDEFIKHKGRNVAAATENKEQKETETAAEK